MNRILIKLRGLTTFSHAGGNSKTLLFKSNFFTRKNKAQYADVKTAKYSAKLPIYVD
jgi:hypothetical protein